MLPLAYVIQRCPGEKRRSAKRPHPSAGVWCSHTRRCFACDRHSCASCRLWRCADGVATGELVADELVRRRTLIPAAPISVVRSGSTLGSTERAMSAMSSAGGEALAESAGTAGVDTAAFTLLLDFDRTLCTTRCGNPPVVGRHRIDGGLVALAARAVRSGGSVAIVTRNGNFDAIRAFLAARMPLPGGVEQLTSAEGGVAVRCVKREGVGKGELFLFVCPTVTFHLRIPLTMCLAPHNIVVVLRERRRRARGARGGAWAPRRLRRRRPRGARERAWSTMRRRRCGTPSCSLLSVILVH